jgi:hypothetical protein
MQAVTWLMWLALPLTALRYWWAWDRLPARMATHFNAAGQPNGWMTREAALEFGLGFTLLFLAVFTVISYVLQKQKASDAGSWALLGLFGVVVGVIYQGNSSIIDYNLTGRPISIITPFVFIPAVIVLLVIFLGAKRGRALPGAALIAEEKHASLIMGFMVLIALVAALAAFANVSDPGARWAAAPVGLVFALCAGFAWSGFQYRFSPEGVEIRTLGFRLRSIPAAEIRDYSIEGWNILRGYGIRGIGNRRAYVWGNKVVHIRTTQGDVYLGHDEPEKIVHDLDMIRKNHQGHEVARS